MPRVFGGLIHEKIHRAPGDFVKPPRLHVDDLGSGWGKASGFQDGFIFFQIGDVGPGSQNKPDAACLPADGFPRQEGRRGVIQQGDTLSGPCVSQGREQFSPNGGAHHARRLDFLGPPDEAPVMIRGNFSRVGEAEPDSVCGIQDRLKMLGDLPEEILGRNFFRRAGHGMG